MMARSDLVLVWRKYEVNFTQKRVGDLNYERARKGDGGENFEFWILDFEFWMLTPDP
jgi:hypothetical protein